MIPVTKPFSPPIEEYQKIIEGIWKRNWFTNNGPLVNDLELKLKEYLGLNHLLYVTNGTIAIQLALKALNINKEVITTPFSYVATTSSLVWEGCNPIFVDIDPNTLNIDPNKIEDAITENTQAILATHCFGNPCDVEAIDRIAKKYNLKVIYDAAHCFGTKYKGKSIFEWGDICTTSFHATKLFHTIEGGAVFSKDPELIKQLAWRRNFGHDGPENFHGVGINGKNSEFHAAMGIVNLNYINQILDSRKKQASYYFNMLGGKNIIMPIVHYDVEFNHSYFPVVFGNEDELLRVKKELELGGIFPRRYFYPTLSSLNYVENGITPIADQIAKSILCLPMYFELGEYEIEMICRRILRVLNN
jgi:dTDP-4-amino-4,6-dideoxygalactose transaminase